MSKRSRRTFTGEFKAEAVRLVKVGDRSIGKLALELGVVDSVPRAWIANSALPIIRGSSATRACSGTARSARVSVDIAPESVAPGGRCRPQVALQRARVRVNLSARRWSVAVTCLCARGQRVFSGAAWGGDEPRPYDGRRL